jgi:predicted small secreted protein
LIAQRALAKGCTPGKETVMKAVRKAIFWTVLAGALAGQGALLSACNTAQGFGQDVKNTGTDIQNGAANAKEKM